MKAYDKKDFPVDKIRRFVEPGPIVLVSSAWKDGTNIMTMGWHMVMGFEPSLIGCYIWSDNHSFDMIRKSKACVINIPTDDLATKVVGIGNTSGRDIDKFTKFRLTAVPGTKVEAPLVEECYANFECKLVDFEPDQDLQPVCLGGREGPCGGVSQISAHAALPGRRRVHDLRDEHEQISQRLQAAEFVMAAGAGDVPLHPLGQRAPCRSGSPR